MDHLLCGALFGLISPRDGELTPSRRSPCPVAGTEQPWPLPLPAAGVSPSRPQPQLQLVPTLEARRTHCIRAVMLPTSLSTFLLLMSARQDRLRRMLDTTWAGAEKGQGGPRAQAPILHPCARRGWGQIGRPSLETHHTQGRGRLAGRKASGSGTPCRALLAPRPTPARYLVELLALGSQLGHNGLHAAPAGTQRGLLV